MKGGAVVRIGRADLSVVRCGDGDDASGGDGDDASDVVGVGVPGAVGGVPGEWRIGAGAVSRQYRPTVSERTAAGFLVPVPWRGEAGVAVSGDHAGNVVLRFSRPVPGNPGTEFYGETVLGGVRSVSLVSASTAERAFQKASNAFEDRHGAEKWRERDVAT